VSKGRIKHKHRLEYEREMLQYRLRKQTKLAKAKKGLRGACPEAGEAGAVITGSDAAPVIHEQ
jgi:hypothetical protein